MSTIRSPRDDRPADSSPAAAIVAAVSGVLALGTAVAGIWMLGR
jgi:hypothetical protein